MRKLAILLTLFTVLLAVGTVHAQNIIYVNDDATGANNGTSWADAYTGFQAGVNAASVGDSVFIAAGTYQPDAGESFSMKQGVKIYGGFAGTETSLAQRRPPAGGLQGAGASILKGNGSGVIRNNNNGLDTSAVLDGFTITGGTADFGGGIYNEQSSPAIVNTMISNNSARYNGGGMLNARSSSPTIVNTTIAHNSAEFDGGGMLNARSSSPTIVNTTIAHNSAEENGGGMANSNSSSPTIVNTTIAHNSAEFDGGGMANSNSSSPTIVNTTIAHNSAKFDGGMYNFSSSPAISNSIIFGNRLTDASVSNIDNDGSTPVFKYSLVGGATTWNTDWGTNGGNNIATTANPFRDAANGDFSLKPGPAVDGGSNTLYSAAGGDLANDTDLAGNLRLYGDSIDMGAYEHSKKNPAAGNILYVNQNVSGGNQSGDSWANAIPELADALKWARQQQDADGNWLQNDSLRIFIAIGVYKPLYNAADGSYTADGDRDNAFVMVKNVQLYGGFDPANGIDSLDNTCIFGAAGTTLSGDIGTPGDNSDNTYHIVISSGDAGHAALNGLVISGGNADGNSYIIVNGIDLQQRAGGGMINANSSPAVLHTTISDNSAFSGGGMYLSYSSPVIRNTAIVNNSAEYDGGGILASSSSPALTNMTIANNSAQDGGGMHNISNASPTVMNSIIWGNRQMGGGASNILTTSGTPVFRNCLVGGESWNTGWGTDGGDNIIIATTTNPFADTASGDFSLRPGPAVNRGNNGLYTFAGGDLTNDRDLAGNVRVADLVHHGMIDIGAYEYQLRPDVNGILYVDSAAVPGGNGSSWGQALKYLSDALLLADYSTEVTSVYVARGTYYPTGVQGSTNRDNTFALQRGQLKIYGGFDPDNGIKTLNDARILPSSGEGSGTILSGNIGDATDNDDNSYHVMVIAGLPAGIPSLVLDGLTITGGVANGENAQSYHGLVIERNYGGGMYVRQVADSVLWFVHCSFLDNRAAVSGGGMINKIASPIFLNCVLAGNLAGDEGGGMYNSTQSIPVLTNCTVSGNRAAHGGGMHNNNASARITNSIIYGNNSGIESEGSGNVPLITYSLVQGISGGSEGNLDGNIDPVFVNAPDASTAPFTGGDYHLQAASPVINKGVNDSIPAWDSTDLAGARRISGSTVDMGAYEYQIPPIAPDANGILYVDSAAASYGDGSSWDNAIPELADALKWARQQHDADGNWLQNDSLRIFIAKGVYKPLYSAEDGVYMNDSARNNAFVMVKNVQLYGGFDPANGIDSLDDTRILPSPPAGGGAGGGSVLSGDIGTPDDSTDNTYHVVVSAGDVGHAALNGLVISSGNARDDSYITVNGMDVYTSSGGGIYNESSSPAVRNTMILNNSATSSGGGIYNYKSSLVILYTIISNNSSVDYGGGMANLSSFPTIRNTMISNNLVQSGVGGGVFNVSSSPTILNTTISNNLAQYSIGGGMYDMYSSSPAINNSIIFGNRRTDGSVSNISNDGTSTPVFKYSLVGGATGWNTNWGTDGGNNIATTANPFRDTANGDFSLVPGPAVNGGSNMLYTDAGGDLADDTDLAGNPRIFNDTVDMGAYEYQHVLIRPDAGGILYVDSAAVSGGNGSSWDKALNYLSDAIFAANQDSVNHEIKEIHVARGTYYPTGAQNGTNRDSAFALLRGGLKIYGGFDPANGIKTLNDARILPSSGEGSGTILSGNIGDATDNDDNSYHVMVIAGLPAGIPSLVLDGLTITGGVANGENAQSYHGLVIERNYGGGMYVRQVADSVLWFAHCSFMDNQAAMSGGGMINKIASPIFLNCVLAGNLAGDEGGGMYNSTQSIPVLTNCTVSGNRAAHGGGMHNNNASARITNSIIYGNSSGIENEGSGNALITYSLVQGISGGSDGNMGGNIDPVFVNAPDASTAPFAGGNYQLQPTSPAINKGINASVPAWDTTDLASNARISGSRVDMGAYEYQIQPIAPDANGILYVDSSNTANYAADGSSWDKALPSFGDALAAAKGINAAATTTDDSVRQVWVAKGTYQPKRDSSFFMLPKVKIYGGFAGRETSLDQRNLGNSSASILKGNNNRVICNDNNNLDTAAVLDGFMITGGKGNIRSDGGNGIYNSGVSPTLSHLVISGNSSYNHYGGGMYNDHSSPEITNCFFLDNTSNYYGGGMCNDHSSPVIINCVFSGNEGQSCGGMYNINASSPAITNCVFSNNEADEGGGMWNENSSPVITNCVFSGNKADEGEAMWNENSSIVITNSIIYGNKRGYDGEMWNENSALMITYSIVEGGYAGTGNIDADPLFTDPANDDYSLKAGSPAINMGRNDSIPAGDTLDLAGNPRIFDDIVDMGAYEFYPVTPGAGNILYVNQNVSGGNQSGNSWANAIPQLADALKWARQQHDADADWLQNDSLRIFIAKGVYKPLYSAEDSVYMNDSTRDNAFVMVKNVQLYGGFDPASGIESLDDTRILPSSGGAGGGSVLSGDIGTPDDSTDNTYHVVVSSGDVGHAALDGLVISEGNADGNNSITVEGAEIYQDTGGGMYNDHSSPAIVNTTISNNSANFGGGMANNSSSPAIVNTTISNNSANFGGGMANYFSSSPVISNTTISHNSANFGGGMYNNSSDPTIVNTTITNNSVLNYGGGMYNDVSSSPTIVNTTISNNSTHRWGGGMANDVSSSPTIVNTTITNNSAQSAGGGMANLNSSSPAILNTTISNNSANFGGGIYNEYSSSPTIVNTTVSHNSAGNNGGGIYNNSSSSPAISNSIVFGNRLTDGSVSNISNDGTSTPVFKYSLVGGAAAWNTGWGTDDGNNIATTANPFEDTINGDFSLIPGPAVNGGSNTLYTNAGGDLANDADLAGNPRIIGDTVDMGAYESSFVFVHPDTNGILYVDSAAAPYGDGSSWAKALNYLSDAVMAANMDSHTQNIKEIHVAKGTYYPTGEQSNTTRDSTFVLSRNGLQLLGGYPTGGGVRSSESHKTILSGDIGQTGDTADNSYHVMVIVGNTFNNSDSLVIDGFTITDGNAHGNGNDIHNGITTYRTDGGGMDIRIVEDSTCIISHCVFVNNFALYGAGMHNAAASPVIIHCTFEDNTAIFGGAIENVDNSTLTVAYSSFINNKAAAGGAALDNDASTAFFSNTIFTKNIAGNTAPLNIEGVTHPAGAIGTGGVLQNQNNDGKAILTNCLITYNEANGTQDDGGGAIMAYDNSSTVLNNCTLYGNTTKSSSKPEGNSFSIVSSASVTLSNSIVYGTQEKQIKNLGVFSSSYSLIKGDAGTANHNLNGTTVTPEFADIGNDDFRLLSGSPAINAGNNDSITAWDSTDLAGNPRIFNDTVDMGAYEFQDDTVQIIIQPKDSTVCSGEEVSFSITTTSTVLGYQWQSSPDGSGWNDMTGEVSAILDIQDVQQADSGKKYRVILTGNLGKDTSAVATLHVNTQVVITLQPKDTAVSAGDDASFSVAATGTNISYQWQLSSDNGTNWNDIGGEKGTTLQLSAISTAYNGRQYRAMVSGDCGNIPSNSATLTVSAPVLTLSPAALSPGFENVAYSQNFTVSGGTMPYTYTETGTLPAGLTFANGKLSGKPTETGHFSFNIKAEDNTDGTLGGPFSVTKTYALDINKSGSCITITSAPHDVTVCEGGNAAFSITVSGATGYQWQRSENGGHSWLNISDATDATLSLTGVTFSETPEQYRVVIKSNCGDITSGAVTLHVNPISHTTLNKTICYGEAYNFGGSNISQSGTYKDTLPSYTGCDSVVVLNLTVRPEIKTTLNKTVCYGEAYSFGGSNISQSGMYKDTLPSYTGCDSVVVLNLTVRPEIKTTLDKTVCYGEAYNFGGNNISQSGTYKDTLPSYTGCDSVVVLNLTVRSEIKTMLDKTICNGDAYYFGGTNITQSGTYKDTLPSYTGCDSVVLLNLTVRPEIKTMLDKTICNGDAYYFGGEHITQSGTYKDTLPSYTGCDSVVVLHLNVNAKAVITVQPENTTICHGGNAVFTVSATGTDLSYQWQSSREGSTWNNVSEETSETLALSNVETAESGTRYRVVVSGACGNTISDAATLTVNALTAITTQPEDVTVCANSNASFTVSATGTNLSYQWQSSADGTDWDDVSGETSKTLNLTGSGTSQDGMQYRVRVTGTCESVTSDAVTLTVNPLPAITIVADSANPVSKGWTVHLMASGAQQYSWNNNPDIQSGWNEATLVVRPQKNATYTVKGTSADGCMANQSYSITTVTDYNLICNNIVSPDGDGKNDTWVIQNISSYRNNELMIFDKTGRIIFHKRGYNNRWDGRIRGGELHEGTYYYVFIVDGGKKVFKGFIELLNGKR